MAKLDNLLKRQEQFAREIFQLRSEISNLQQDKRNSDIYTPASVAPDVPAQIPTIQPRRPEVKPPPPSAPRPRKPIDKSALEKFIGENLINKIGILITVIGVAIGAKYSIDHNLISPLTRIILGYLMGTGLLATGMKLKLRYEGFSAVLVSGAMAIFYFITYLGYDLYNLLPQAVAFGLMLLFTVFTVFAAIRYNRQVIAHIGLVGAYAVPFLLSDGSGRVVILFSYIAIINAGILIVSFRKYWKPVYYAAFIWTWLIVFVWWVSQYDPAEHFALGLAFTSLFFLLFYATFLAYKTGRNEILSKSDVILLLANSFICYGFGYAILEPDAIGSQLLGLFTLGHALVHFAVSTLVYRRRLADRKVFFLVAGLVLVFITLAIPVQLNGMWVTVLWSVEAALLFWIGRMKNSPVYEKLSYPLMLLAFISICQDWATTYEMWGNPAERILPLLNVYFLNSAIVIAAFAFINKWHISTPPATESGRWQAFYRILSFVLPGVLLYLVYNTFRLEIAHYWNQLYAASELQIQPEGQTYPDYYQNRDLILFRDIWLVNYALLFFSLLSLLNARKLKNETLSRICLVLNTLAILVFLTWGLYTLSELRQTYLQQTLEQYYRHSAFNIWIRYISLACAAFTLWVTHTCLLPFRPQFRIAFDLLLHLSVVWIASSELISWLDISGSAAQYKLGLSILWGIYSLLLIVLGIWKRKMPLRIGAMVLFGITLVKLFFYDIVHLDTIAKTIVFVSLGTLLLVISFLYNKYKKAIADETTDETGD